MSNIPSIEWLGQNFIPSTEEKRRTKRVDAKNYETHPRKERRFGFNGTVSRELLELIDWPLSVGPMARLIRSIIALKAFPRPRFSSKRERVPVVIRSGGGGGGSRKGGEEGQIIRSRAGQLGESPCSLERRKEETREKVKGWRDAREPNRPE